MDSHLRYQGNQGASDLKRFLLIQNAMIQQQKHGNPATRARRAQLLQLLFLVFLSFSLVYFLEDVFWQTSQLLSLFCRGVP